MMGIFKMRAGLISSCLFVFKLFFVFFLSFPVLNLAETYNPKDSYGKLYAPTENTTGGESIPICTEELLLEVKEAASGMDLAGYAAVSTVIQQATSTMKGDDDKSARRAHQAQGGIQSAVAVAATATYATCTTAIGACTTACGATSLAEGSTVTPERATAIASECSTFTKICNSAGLQALLSAAQAGIAFWAAGQLGDCEGANCNSGPPSNAGLNLSQSEGYDAVDQGIQQSEQKQAGLDTSLPGPNGNGEAGDSPQSDGSKKGFRSLGEAGIAGIGTFDASGSQESSSEGGGFPYRATSSSSGGDVGEDFEEEYEDGEVALQAQSVGGSFIGGESSRGYSKGSSSGSSRRGGSGRNILASGSQKTDNALKRNVFASGGAHVSIFEKMSRVIQSFCSKGGEKCK